MLIFNENFLSLAIKYKFSPNETRFSHNKQYIEFYLLIVATGK